MILTKHSLTVEANCPVDDTLDVYSVTVETTRLIEVEEILSKITGITRRPIHQEDFTRLLAKLLQAKVITVGEHSGITTTCEAAVW